MKEVMELTWFFPKTRLSPRYLVRALKFEVISPREKSTTCGGHYSRVISKKAFSTRKGRGGKEGVCEESTGAHDSKREILKNVAQRVSARKVAFKNDTRKPNTDTPAINLIETNTRVP